jgi:hypothetical protein
MHRVSWTFMVFIMAYMRVHLAYLWRVHGRSCTFMQGVHVGGHADKLCLVDHAIGSRADPALINQFGLPGAKSGKFTVRAVAEIILYGHGKSEFITPEKSMAVCKHFA